MCIYKYPQVQYISAQIGFKILCNSSWRKKKQTHTRKQQLLGNIFQIQRTSYLRPKKKNHTEIYNLQLLRREYSNKQHGCAVQIMQVWRTN